MIHSLCFSELVSLEDSPAYRIQGENNTKVRLLQSYGLPYTYSKSALDLYETIPYGVPYTVLQAPDLSRLPRLTFLTLMLSRACDDSLRMTIRNSTCGSQHEEGFHIVFVMARSCSVCDDRVREENARYRDILQLDHVDSYHNITLSVLHAFHFVHNLRLPVRYVLKTDSDCVVNYALLRRYARFVSRRRDDVYMGNCKRDMAFNTIDPTKKNFIPNSLVGTEKRYSYYATGGGYLVSYSLLPRLLVGASHLRFIGHFEDVNVGRAMKLVGVECLGLTRRWIARYGCPTREECLKYVIMHPQRSAEEVVRFYSYLSFRVCCSDILCLSPFVREFECCSRMNLVECASFLK